MKKKKMLKIFLEKENIYSQALNLKLTYLTNSILKGFKNLKGLRSWSYKKEKEKNVKNIFGKKKHLLFWNPPTLPVLFQKNSRIPKIQEADPTKRKKRMLETFLEKENIYLKP